MRTPVLAPSLLLGALAVTGCSSGPTDATADPAASAPPEQTSTSAPLSAAPSPLVAAGDGDTQGQGEPTVVRFSGGGTAVDVTLGPETPTTRDFLSLLPFTTNLEEFAGREKIGNPPRQLDVEGTPGSDPEDGDLIYFVPWGNLGFSYDSSGIGYSDATPHLGTYEATEEQLSRLEGQQVTVEVVE